MPLLSPLRRQRLLQIGFAAVGVGAVVVADRIAALLGVGREATFFVLGGRVLGGWSLGLAFRLQFTRSTRPDPQLRWLFALPAGIVTAWPLVASVLPAAVRATLPGRVLAEAATLAGFTAVVLGLALALSVTPGRRRN